MRQQFDTINILDMLGAIGEAELQQCLSDFSCLINPEIEQFVLNNAIEFDRVGGYPLVEQPTSHTTVRTVRYTAVQ